MLVVGSSGGEVTVYLAGAAGEPPLLWIMPTTLDFGTLAPGATASHSFTVRNGGGSDLVITKSKPPGLGVFRAASPLDEGTVIAPGVARTLSVAFAPAAPGAFQDQWLITGDDGNGMSTVTFTGSVVAVSPPDAGADPAQARRGRALAPLVAPAVGKRTRPVFPEAPWGGVPWQLMPAAGPRRR